MAGVPWIAELGLISLGVLSASQGVFKSQTLGADIIISGTSVRSVVLGDDARAFDDGTDSSDVVVVGSFARAVGAPFTVVIGAAAQCFGGDDSVIIGASASSPAAGTIAIGRFASISNSDSNYAIVMGESSFIEPQCPESVVIGRFGYLDINSPRTILIGVDTWGKGSDNVFLGYQTNFAGSSEGGTGSGVVLLGASTSIDLATGANNSIGLGHWAQVRGDGVLQIGDNNSAGGTGDGTKDVTSIVINDGDEVVTVTNPLTFEGALFVEDSLQIGDSGTFNGSFILNRSTPGTSGFFEVRRFGGGDYGLLFDSFGAGLARFTIYGSGQSVSLVAGEISGTDFIDIQGMLDGDNNGVFMQGGRVVLTGATLIGAFANSLQSTAINETLVREVSAVIQTNGGVTTTLWDTPDDGDTLSIRNKSAAANTIAAGALETIEGAATLALASGDSVTLIFEASSNDWTIF